MVISSFIKEAFLTKKHCFNNFPSCINLGLISTPVERRFKTKLVKNTIFPLPEPKSIKEFNKHIMEKNQEFFEMDAMYNNNKVLMKEKSEYLKKILSENPDNIEEKKKKVEQLKNLNEEINKIVANIIDDKEKIEDFVNKFKSSIETKKNTINSQFEDIINPSNPTQYHLDEISKITQLKDSIYTTVNTFIRIINGTVTTIGQFHDIYNLESMDSNIKKKITTLEKDIGVINTKKNIKDHTISKWINTRRGNRAWKFSHQIFNSLKNNKMTIGDIESLNNQDESNNKRDYYQLLKNICEEIIKPDLTPKDKSELTHIMNKLIQLGPTIPPPPDSMITPPPPPSDANSAAAAAITAATYVTYVYNAVTVALNALPPATASAATAASEKATPEAEAAAMAAEDKATAKAESDAAAAAANAAAAKMKVEAEAEAEAKAKAANIIATPETEATADKPNVVPGAVPADDGGGGASAVHGRGDDNDDVASGGGGGGAEKPASAAPGGGNGGGDEKPAAGVDAGSAVDANNTTNNDAASAAGDINAGNTVDASITTTNATNNINTTDDAAASDDTASDANNNHNNNNTNTNKKNSSGGGGGGTGAAGGDGGNGGSGLVILRFTTSDATISVGPGLTISSTTSGSDTIVTFTAGTGTVSFS